MSKILITYHSPENYLNFKKLLNNLDKFGNSFHFISLNIESQIKQNVNFISYYGLDSTLVSDAISNDNSHCFDGIITIFHFCVSVSLSFSSLFSVLILQQIYFQ